VGFGIFAKRTLRRSEGVSRSYDRQNPAAFISLVLQARASDAMSSPRQQEGNPMNWVSQRTTRTIGAVVMTPKQAFEVLLNTPEPRRTLTLSDAATALRDQNCWA